MLRTLGTTPRLRVRVPRQLDAWERATAKVTIRNSFGQTILPISVTLSTMQGVIEQWGIEGGVVRWAQRVRGRKQNGDWEVLMDPYLQSQQMAPPPAFAEEVGSDLLRIEPLLPSESVELLAQFDAAYQHGARIDATLTYIPLDAENRPICAVTKQPARTGFVACERISRLTEVNEADLYMPAEELGRGRQVVQASARLNIRRPSFDIESARSRAGVAEGPFGYDIQAGIWIIVDPQQRRTLLVGADGPVEELPGDWLDRLIALNVEPSVYVYWQTTLAEETEHIRSRLDQAGIEVRPFAHKGHVSPTGLIVSINRGNASVLGRLMREMGARLEGSQVVR